MQITGYHQGLVSNEMRVWTHFKYKTFNDDGSVKIQSDSQQLDHAYAFKLSTGESVYDEQGLDNNTDLYFTTQTQTDSHGRVKNRWPKELLPCNKARFFHPEF